MLQLIKAQVESPELLQNTATFSSTLCYAERNPTSLPLPFPQQCRAQCTRTYLLLFFSLMWSLVSRICPFLSHVIWGGGSPWATHVKMAVVPTGLEMDWGCCTNSAGAERRKKKEGEKSYDDPTLSCTKNHLINKPCLPGNVEYLANPQHRQQTTLVWMVCL